MLGRILVPLDDSDLSEGILIPVRRLLAQQEGTSATFVQVVPGGGLRFERSFEEAETHLEHLVHKLKGEQLRAAHLVRRGDPAEQILEAVAMVQPDLVAMATHGRSGVTRWVRGSVAERVLRHCKAPLLLCNPDALESARKDPPFKHILVPLDGSEAAARILPLVRTFAIAFKSRVTLLVVDDESGGEPSDKLRRSVEVEQALEPAKKHLEEAGVEIVEIRTAAGNPAECILAVAEREPVDLVAMCTHGRSGVSRWRFGSVAETVLRHCPHPLLVRRLPEA